MFPHDILHSDITSDWDQGLTMSPIQHKHSQGICRALHMFVNLHAYCLINKDMESASSLKAIILYIFASVPLKVLRESSTFFHTICVVISNVCIHNSVDLSMETLIITHVGYPNYIFHNGVRKSHHSYHLSTMNSSLSGHATESDTQTQFQLNIWNRDYRTNEIIVVDRVSSHIW